MMTRSSKATIKHPENYPIEIWICEATIRHAGKLSDGIHIVQVVILSRPALDDTLNYRWENTLRTNKSDSLAWFCTNHTCTYLSLEHLLPSRSHRNHGTTHHSSRTGSWNAPVKVCDINSIMRPYLDLESFHHPGFLATVRDMLVLPCYDKALTYRDCRHIWHSTA